MTRVMPPGFQTSLDSGATTMALAWRVDRTDGVIQGFTEHDRDLTFESVTYLASAGFTASRMKQSLGLSADNLSVVGALSSDTLNEDDLAAGVYDNAQVELWYVNWQNTAERILLDRGNIGDVARSETNFSAEFRSMLDRMNQTTGRTLQRACDAVLGDGRCTVDLNQLSFKATGTVTTQTGRALALSGLSAFGDGSFTLGLFTLTSGANAGKSFEVKSHVGANINLWKVPAEPVTGGTTFSMTVGCRKDLATCRDSFANVLFHRGQPYIPGVDFLAKYPRKDDEEMDGGSLFR